MADMAVICTNCGNTLGLVTNGELEIRHKQRTVGGLDPASPNLRIVCEECQSVWLPIFPLQKLARKEAS